MRTTKRILVSVIAGVLFLSLANVGSGLAQEELLDEPQIPGVVEGTGTHFELSDSEYLNIVVDSSEPIRLFLESVPEMITMHLESASGASSTYITLSGFIPQTVYHKYEDDYHNHVAFTTDASGSYAFTQDLSGPHLLFIQPRSSTFFLIDTSWWEYVGEDLCEADVDCTWDTGTVTLNQDLEQTIQIDSDGITLNGGEHTITGTGTGNGVYLPANRTGVTIKNLTVTNFSNGINLFCSDNNDLMYNTVSNSYYGIYVGSSSNNNDLMYNTASNNTYGIRLCYSSGNNLTGNTASNNTYGIRLNWSGSNKLRYNVMYENIYNFYVAGKTLPDYVQDIDITNTVTVDEKPIYYLVDATNVIIEASTNPGAGYVGVVNSSNVTVEGLTLKNNGQGVLFAYTSDSSIVNVTTSDNCCGIYLYCSGDNNLTGNTVSDNEYGVFLYRSGNNDLNGNEVSSNYYGIYFCSSTNNSFMDNTIPENEVYLAGEVNQLPVANAGDPYTGTEGSAIDFYGSGYDPDGTILSCSWDFGDGTVATDLDLSPSHTYGDNGQYMVTFTVADNSELLVTATTTVTVANVVPVVDAGLDQTVECCVDEVSFSGSFTDPGWLDTHTIEWDFGDGDTAEGTLTPTHNYCQVDTYTVTLTVTDDDGGVGSDSLVVTVVDTTCARATKSAAVEKLESAKCCDTDCDNGCDNDCDKGQNKGWNKDNDKGWNKGDDKGQNKGWNNSYNNDCDNDCDDDCDDDCDKCCKILDKEIDKIIDWINSSLDEKLWVDDSHLNPKYGDKVFQNEKLAVLHILIQIKTLEKENRGWDTGKKWANCDAIETVLPVFREVIDDLVEVDSMLATVAIDDAKDTEVQNPKYQRIVDRQIDRAEKELGKAYQELGQGRPDKAIMRFKKAWQHAQLAIEFANKSNSGRGFPRRM